MPAVAQRKLVLDDRPTLVLATVSSARHYLPGHDEDDILALIEEFGFIAFAWNIALTKTASREIRIFPGCLEWYARTHGRGQYSRTEDQVFADLLAPIRQDFIKGKTLGLILNCSGTHIINLIEARLLTLQSGTSWSAGRNGTPLITVASAKQFLTSRRL